MKLEELIKRCTVKLSINNIDIGTGFFVTPNYILTCEHVVRGIADPIQVWGWQNKYLEESIVCKVNSQYDIALLSLVSTEEIFPCVYFDSEEPALGDKLYLFGYGQNSNNNEPINPGEPVTVEFEGITGDQLLKYKLGRIEPGMSGAAIVNFRTGKVCGMSKYTVDQHHIQGGGGIPIANIKTCLPRSIIDLQKRFHKNDKRWSKAEPLHQTKESVSIKRRVLLSFGFFTTVSFSTALLLSRFSKITDPYELNINLKLKKEKSNPQKNLVEFNTLTIDSSKKVSQANSPKENQYRIEKCGRDATIDFRKIPEGQFTIGTFDPPSGAQYEDETPPPYPIKITQFWMAKSPITQLQWKSVAKLGKIKRSLPVNFAELKNDKEPVVNISWLEAVEFCERLSKFNSSSGCIYSLPSEAQWEYACRANTSTSFHFGSELIPELANYNKYRSGLVQVDHFRWANEFGLYQMHGNIWELCQDIKYDNYYQQGKQGIPDDGRPWISKDLTPSAYLRRDRNILPRVMRGGAWDSPQEHCRSTVRGFHFETERHKNIGFRIICMNNHL